MGADQDLEIRRVDGLALVRCRAPQTAPLRDLLDRMPPSAGHAIQLVWAEVLWRSPGVWWVKSRDHAAHALIARLEGAASAIDISDSQVTFALDGPRARTTLARGCPIDLHPGSFPPDSVAATRFEHFDVVIHARGDESFDLHVPRSYARDAEDWLRRCLDLARLDPHAI